MYNALALRNWKEYFFLDNNIKKLENKSKIKITTGISIVGFILSLMAGWVDTIGVKLFLTESSSFITGRARLLGYYLFHGDFKSFSGIFLIIASFIMGAFLSTKITKKYGLKGGLIAAGILVTISSLPISWKYMNIIFLPMGMGCQNAATSLTPINRTTHLTGPMTDLGIHLAKRDWNKVLFWVLRLAGFPLGAFIGFGLASLLDNNPINISILLIIPAIIIILTGIIQEKIFDIPLLD